jgi:hypothetical protein
MEDVSLYNRHQTVVIIFNFETMIVTFWSTCVKLTNYMTIMASLPWQPQWAVLSVMIDRERCSQKRIGCFVQTVRYVCQILTET